MAKIKKLETYAMRKVFTADGIARGVLQDHPIRVTSNPAPVLTRDDLFDLRDALIHAERAHAHDPAATALRQKYQALFRKIGAIISTRERDTTATD